MDSSAVLTVNRAPGRILVRETTVLVGVAVALPFVVHLIPSETVPWGGRLLPMFLAPLLGVVLYRLHVGLVVALLAPSLNLLITGSPAPVLVGILTFELVVFTLAAYGMLRRWPDLWFAGPLGYLFAKLASAGAIAILPWLAAFRPATVFALSSIRIALPGLIVLAAVTFAIIQRRQSNTSRA